MKPSIHNTDSLTADKTLSWQASIEAMLNGQPRSVEPNSTPPTHHASLCRTPWQVSGSPHVHTHISTQAGGIRGLGEDDRTL